MDIVFTKMPDPILERSEAYFENKAVYNPTVIKKDGRVYMLYRAEGFSGPTGNIGIAWSEDGVHFQRHDKPVLAPEYDYERKGCEDPRVVELNGRYYMTYVPIGMPDGTAHIALASSDDLFTWKKHGPIQMKLSDWCGNKIKAPAIAPVQVNGQYVLYFLGQKKGWHTAIGVAYSTDLLHWTEDARNPVMMPRKDNLDSLGIEPGATPFLRDNMLMLVYNAWGEDKVHRSFLAGFGMDDPGRLEYRSNAPILSPELKWERQGQVKDIIFSEGILRMNDRYYLYYGAADTCIGLAISEKLEDA